MTRLKNAAILVMVWTMFFPAIAAAAPQVGERLPPAPPPGKGAGGSDLQVTWVTDQHGNRQRVAHRIVPNEGGQRLDYWLIENNMELANLKVFLAAEGGQEILADGFRRLPKGGWIWWNDGWTVLYVSHENALAIALGLGVIVIWCSHASKDPYLAHLGAVCQVLAELSVLTIVALDELGEPGFRIMKNRISNAIYIRP